MVKKRILSHCQFTVPKFKPRVWCTNEDEDVWSMYMQSLVQRTLIEQLQHAFYPLVAERAIPPPIMYQVAAIETQAMATRHKSRILRVLEADAAGDVLPQVVHCCLPGCGARLLFLRLLSMALEGCLDMVRHCTGLAPGTWANG
jgi:hypothetical protein